MAKRAYTVTEDQRASRATAYEFHISRVARDSLGLSDSLVSSSSGDKGYPDIQSLQSVVSLINSSKLSDSRIGGKKKRRKTSPGELNALLLLHEVLHFVIDSYARIVNRRAFDMLQGSLLERMTTDEVSTSLRNFVELFPPACVYNGLMTSNEYLQHRTGQQPNSQVALKGLLLLWLENQNPAYLVIGNLIEDSELKRSSSYQEVIDISKEFFETQPKYGPANESLVKMLLGPMRDHPDSVNHQLRFIAERWRGILADSPYLSRILNAIDYINEEGKYFLMLEQARTDKLKVPKVRDTKHWRGLEKGSVPVLQFRTGAEYEPENFSTDLSWMPRLVLIAKNVFVWLDQLSSQYRRPITHLDQVPDEELELLGRRGFTGLWLIGIWKRSPASQKIKNINGNRDAMASAYSLESYDISPELGGTDAFQNLKFRASNYGIRLASDMVPNHMGIDSRWLVGHPNWFLRSEDSPFQNYSFDGPDLSNDDRVGVFIENGYWTKTDAAVVFRRLDRWTGETRYIYHGNDGTHMPWNDTAQLDFTNPEVREAVVQTILHVARLFPIIRFDAAMVLTKKHYQRLWFPEPGTAGAIPSRSRFSMTKEQFDELMPAEFWREVVDRVQNEVPDTLLLAEAFWLMEGYFVRTLGMHRVYNSAFMNMLKNEENANYRQVIKNVLEYNPQILKRFVNFQNNPDEETAVAQFGKDDKYFGVCMMMATMPGLPMFGHGQIEGFTEKYGMEFRRAGRSEEPDGNLVSRHEREIFPLLRKRQMFSEVDHFLLYGFYTGNGTVNEDVFAYSNICDKERSLVVYNNRYASTAGWIKVSTAFRDAGGRLLQKTLAEGLALGNQPNHYLVFRDVITGMEYIRPLHDVKKDGLYVELGAYKYNVFMDFREVESTMDLPYAEFCGVLNGRGVFNLEEELSDYKLRDVHAAFREAINTGSISYLLDGLEDESVKQDHEAAFEEKKKRLAEAAGRYVHNPSLISNPSADVSRNYRAVLTVKKGLESFSTAESIAKMFAGDDRIILLRWRNIFVWDFLERLGKDVGDERFDPVTNWRLQNQLRILLREEGADDGTVDQDMKIVRALLKCRFERGDDTVSVRRLLPAALDEAMVHEAIDVHSYADARWFNKEKFEGFIGYFILAKLVKDFEAQEPTFVGEESMQVVRESLREGDEIFRSAAKCEYKFDSLVETLRGE